MYRTFNTIIMKKQLIIIFALLSTSFSFAQEGHKPIQIALFNPVQVVNQDLSVHGFRLDILYGENQDMVGFDVGIVNKTNGIQRGAQVGIVSITEGEFNGFRANFVNIGGGQMNGYANGTVNVIGGGNGWINGYVNILEDNYTGLLTGIVNVQSAKQFKGAMLGLVNVVESHKEVKNGKKRKRKGTQIGLVNITESMKGVQIGLVNINKNARVKFCPFILISKKS